LIKIGRCLRADDLAAPRLLQIKDCLPLPERSGASGASTSASTGKRCLIPHH